MACDSQDMLVAETQCPEPEFLPPQRSRLHAEMPGQPSNTAPEPASRGPCKTAEPDHQSLLDKSSAAELRKKAVPELHGSKGSAGPKQAAGRGNGPPLQTFTRQKRRTPESKRGAAATTRSKRYASEAQATAGGQVRGNTEGSDAEVQTSTGERRRIPSRLQPWSCQACTFDNPGAAAHCGMCQAAKQLRHASASGDDAALHGDCTFHLYLAFHKHALSVVSFQHRHMQGPAAQQIDCMVSVVNIGLHAMDTHPHFNRMHDANVMNRPILFPLSRQASFVSDTHLAVLLKSS